MLTLSCLNATYLYMTTSDSLSWNVSRRRVKTNRKWVGRLQKGQDGPKNEVRDVSDETGRKWGVKPLTTNALGPLSRCKVPYQVRIKNVRKFLKMSCFENIDYLDSQGRGLFLCVTRKGTRGGLVTRKGSLRVSKRFTAHFSACPVACVRSNILFGSSVAASADVLMSKFVMMWRLPC